MDSPKYFIDIIQMIHKRHEHVNYSLLLKDAAIHQTLRRMIRTLINVYRHFPHLTDIKELPIHRKISLCVEYEAIRSPNFKQFFNKIYNKFFNFDSLAHTWAALVNFTYSVGNMRFSHKIKRM